MKISPYQIESYINQIDRERIAGCLLFGPNSALTNYRFNLVARKISSDLSDPFLVSNVSKERLSEDKAILADEFFSYPMLGGRKLIIIRDSDSIAGAALKILFSDYGYAKKSENFILIQAGDLDRSSLLRKICEDSPSFAAIACYEDSESVIKKFIADELSKNKIISDEDVVSLLFERFGKNRQIIMLELEKIMIFLGEEKKLSYEVIKKISVSGAEISASEFVDNFVTQKFLFSLLIAEKLLQEGFEAIVLLRFLSNYLQKLYQARLDIDFNGVGFDLAIKNQKLFFKSEAVFRMALKKLSKEFLIKNLSKLQLLEIKMKSDSIPPKLILKGFIQDFIKEK